MYKLVYFYEIFGIDLYVFGFYIGIFLILCCGCLFVLVVVILC